MRERSEIPQVILATLGVLITNAAIFGIGVYLALKEYGDLSIGPYSAFQRPGSNFYFFIIPALSSAVISITQLIYVIPVIIWLNRRGQFALKKGVIIGAVITALLNCGCYSVSQEIPLHILLEDIRILLEDIRNGFTHRR
jgi:hypothetical protein